MGTSIKTKELFVGVSLVDGKHIDIPSGAVLEKKGDAWEATFNGITVPILSGAVDLYLVKQRSSEIGEPGIVFHQGNIDAVKHIRTGVKKTMSGMRPQGYTVEIKDFRGSVIIVVRMDLELSVRVWHKKPHSKVTSVAAEGIATNEEIYQARLSAWKSIQPGLEDTIKYH